MSHRPAASSGPHCPVFGSVPEQSPPFSGFPRMSPPQALTWLAFKPETEYTLLAQAPCDQGESAYPRLPLYPALRVLLRVKPLGSFHTSYSVTSGYTLGLF